MFFPWKHRLLPALEIDYHQGLSNQMSILETIRVAIFESAAVEDALTTGHFSSVMILDLIQFAFLCKLVNLATSSVAINGPPLDELLCERAQRFMNVAFCE